MRSFLFAASAAVAAISTGCGSEVEPPPSGASAGVSGTSGPAGAGGGASASAAAASGSGGAGGAGAGGGGGTGVGGSVVEYRAVNLFTGAPRFELSKKDVARDLCFHLRVLMGAGQSASFDQAGPPFDEMLVSNDASECGDEGGPPPAPPSPSSVPAADADGTLEVSRAPCAVTASFTVAFDDPSAPATETFEVVGLPIEGGCP